MKSHNFRLPTIRLRRELTACPDRYGTVMGERGPRVGLENRMESRDRYMEPEFTSTGHILAHFC